MPGRVDFIGPDEEVQSVEAAGGLIIGVRSVTDRIDGERRMREALHLLGRLPRGTREVFVLAGWQGLSTEDAANALGISPRRRRDASLARP